MNVTRKVMRGDEWVGVLVEAGDAPAYVVPAVVIDDDTSAAVLGREVLAAIVESGVTVEHPIIRTSDPGYVAELERFLSGVKATLGVDGLVL